MPAPMTIQGVGPGGQGPAGYVYGSVIDGSTFQVKDGGAYQTAWYGLAQLVADSAQNPTQISDSEVIYVLTRSGLFGQGNNPARAGIDGLAIEGGDQMSLPGQPQPERRRPGAAPAPRDRPAGHPGRRHLRQRLRPPLQITNNTCRTTAAPTARSASARPTWAGRQRVEPQRERPHRQQPDHRQRRHQPRRRRSAMFAGSDNYEITGNDICGNFSAEYGGGISHFGRSERRPHPRQPHLLQPVVRRGRRDHDRRPAAVAEELPNLPVKRPDAGSGAVTSTTTSSSRTCPTTTAAASGS